MTSPKRLATMGTSPRAIRHHYDLSDDFFRIWLGPDMVYSCGWWEAGDGHDSLAQAQHRKLDFFADRLGVRGGRVLDVGCGWGALLDRFVRVPRRCLGDRAHPEPRPGRLRGPPECA